MTSPVTQITDYEQRIKDDLLSQFARDAPLNALVGVIGAEIQRLEDLLYSVLTDRWLGSATGDVLDVLGKIAGVNRLGRSDADYERIIAVAIAARDSDGGADQVAYIASQLVGADVRYTQLGEANALFEYESDETLSDDLKEEAIALITKAMPAGVSWRLIATEATDGGWYDEDTYGAGTYGTVIGGSY